ncbi:phosphatidylinositol-4-phosphate 5-kinase-like protein [Leishmania mexicana MHOM/GT/2001/U1103]|uniref:Phosphatidylinositol-4-phosphate 5-kinase-like protein n=1 Tax=Leishmania mexicana (strain MHOM/GT/2001/U1103) TaxID=929439 RepID=E9B269_LEIMU|nr:phosphatidylinositol-4-phosphate 5-kinase-like protein [Leishmania mexicana MHOM/GT/2001/U1103]CBZ29330.1 phosphatidylinositol-4-phosphate 5-kinase-like protein [Leishmania mexicana MHOM/GT/2001/U1103]
MSVHSSAQAAAPAPASPQGPESDISGRVTTANELTVKKKKKLLNDVNIKFSFPSGATYEGSVRDGRIEGYGVYTYAQIGDVYEGEWKADLKHGQGCYTFANGDKYTGQWYMGKKQGKGQFVFANGNEYVGSWKTNQMNGYGVFVLASNGDRYEGYWSEGVRQGEGCLYYGNGDLYDGEWCSGQQQGLGVFFQSNDDLYCGQWDAGVMDGKGVLREKGILFLVEYVGGYLILKLRHSNSLDETEKEWAPAYQHYLAWVEHHQAPTESTLSTKEESKLRDELQAVLAENSILRKRLEGLLALHQPKGRSDNSGGKSQTTFLLAALEEAGAEYWKQSLRKLEGRVKLLECTLAERVVEVRKLSEQLKKRDAKVHELELGIAARKVWLCGTKHNCAKETPPFNAQTLCALPEPLEMDIIDADEVNQLRERNAGLVRLNEELQRKVAFLTAENAKLALKEEAAEEQYDKLTEEVEKLRVTLENERRVNMSSEPPKAGDTTATAAVSVSAAVGVSPLVSLPFSPEKSLAPEELQQKLIQANRLNIELRLRMGELERTAQPKRCVAALSLSTQEASGIERENEMLRSVVTSLKAELVVMQSASNDAEQRIVLAHQRQVELEESMKVITHRKAANPQLQEALERKSTRIENLELENAELARLLDETRADLEERQAISVATKRQPSFESSTVGGALSELESAQKEVKKLQRRMKKFTGERNSVTERVYELQVRLARTDRTLGALQGRVIVIASIADGGIGGAAVADAAARVDAADCTKLALSDCGEETTYQYDYCFGKDASVEQVFAELCGPLAFVWSGYQLALMTVGEFRSGKTGLVKEILPLFTKYLSKEAEESPQRLFFSFTYRVAVVEIAARGGFDCASGDNVTEVCCDSSGFVQPKNVRFIECTSGSISIVVDNLLAKRRQHYNGRSHTWIQLQCVRTSVARQCQTVGRLTIFDWCGSALLASQKKDIESARFANASSQGLRDLITALGGKLSVIPYTKSLETSLLFDLLGGNSVTAVIGRIRSSAEHIEETLRTLHVLTSLVGVHNGPLVPDNQTSDEIRWQGIVAALCSDHIAGRELKAVENIREL